MKPKINFKWKNTGQTKILIFLILLFFTSCDSFVEVDLSNSQLTGITVFEDKETANAAMTSIYADIRDNGLITGTSFGLSNNLGVYTDELDFYGDTSFSSFYFYNNTLLPSTSLITNYWNFTYHQIYAANAVYEGVQVSSALPAEDADRLKGEALFVRALLHFYLVNLYGNIPYITITDHTVNSTVSRVPINEVYNLILSDLEQAANLLPENYYTTGRVRPNKSAANALMARTYLYLGLWTEAENTASTVLNNSVLYIEEPDPEQVFLKDCTETIWQLPPAMEGNSTHEAVTFTLFSGPPAMSALTESLVTSFSTGDLRKTFWIGEVTDGVNSWFFARKYKQSSVGSTSSEYSVVLRLTELYLIRAEARAQQGDLTGAKEDLNRVRQRAGIGETTAVSQQEIIEAILMERKLEFFTEYGHRFFDLKRTGKLDSTLEPIKPGWNNSNRLFPIPESELSVNPNLLPQNPGY